MVTPSLFPLLMKGSGGGAALSADGFLVTLEAEPDIVVEADVSVEVDESPIEISEQPDVEIEVE